MGEIYLVHSGSMFVEDFLMHSGRSKVDGAPVGSGRYPLGSGERPYQKGSPGGDRHLSRRERKKGEQPLGKLTDEDKKRIIDEGDVREAYKHRRELTNNDIDAVILRHNKEKSLAELMPKKKTGLDYIQKGAKILTVSTAAVTAGINAWNVIARIHNAKGDKLWPYVPNIKENKGGK